MLARRWWKSIRGRFVKSGAQVRKPPWFVPGGAAPLTANVDELPHLAQSDDRGVVIVSYATRGTEYERNLENLRSQCVRLGYVTSFETIPNCGRVKACLFKPAFLKFKLLTLGRTLVWLDADSELCGQFENPVEDFDLGFLENDRAYKINKNASWCIMIRPTIPALRFLELWEALCVHPVAMPGLDHRRMNYAKTISMGSFREIDISSFVTGCLVRDIGKAKEHRI